MACWRRIATVLAIVGPLVLVQGCETHPTHPVGDDGWHPTVADPAFAPGEGPVVLVDAAHGNWHTIAGRFATFAELLGNDGYLVRSTESSVSTDTLAGVDIFVIANAVKGGEESVWVLPTPPAFSADEIRTLVEWVEGGGALLLIADHMPFPGSVANLAEAFGIVFHNGFAKKSLDEGGTLTFVTSSGTLAEHPIVRGRSSAESVPYVKSFTGQAFRVEVVAEPILLMPEDWDVFFPRVAWEFHADTPSVSAWGLVQGAVLKRGKGRVAVFGEAAMFTAQAFMNDGNLVRVGMNDPDAPHNAQFVLNVAHWLSGLLDQ